MLLETEDSGGDIKSRRSPSCPRCLSFCVDCIRDGLVSLFVADGAIERVAATDAVSFCLLQVSVCGGAFSLSPFGRFAAVP